LQAVSTVALRDPDLLKNARTLRESGLVPEFLVGLPYQSRVMSMNNELWTSWSPDEQDQFMNELVSLTEAYRKFHDNPEGWVRLNEGADADESVYPISLHMLP
jgi:hypothetical protein